MSDLPVLRVIVHPPTSGAMNMAIDNTLLNSAIEGSATLRFYQWDSATVSLGHFQTAQGQVIPDRFDGLPVVRRLSGGGAILHHHELTYSCVLPKSHTILQNPGDLYDLIHDVIISVLRKFGVESRKRGDDAFADESFLCFSRGDARDIVIGRQKIVGSAQRRRQGAVLQHGSVLLKQSTFAEEFPGIEELAGVAITPELLIPDLESEISRLLGMQPLRADLTDDEVQSARLSLTS
ncbi:lipoate--protein ligase family protein [Planctomicrobium sp. SH668]|uniref:lipoate--protein ligase family protein n=1 Tax=Planctomicrobium sp. SH668 TaxID=3448126 RepID=UPI003F5C039F